MKKLLLIICILSGLFVSQVAFSQVRCKAITLKGTQCKRTTNNANGYCWQHQSQATEKSTTADSAKTKKKVSSKPTTTKNGESYNGHSIQTGPRGGKYYINKNGHKTYIKHK